MNDQTVTELTFYRIRDRIHEISGIFLGYEKEYLLRQRLSGIIRDKNLENFEALADYLEKNNPNGWKNDVISAITVNETSFFRDSHPFMNLQKLVQNEFPGRALRILSIGCANGQEPVSISIALQECNTNCGISYRIYGVDIDIKVIEAARKNIYRKEEILRGVPPSFQEKYFVQNPGGDYSASDGIFYWIQYHTENIVHGLEHSIEKEYDIVFLRNVLIYFKPETRERVLQYVHSIMAKGSFLILGASENIFGYNHLFASVIYDKSIFYRKLYE